MESSALLDHLESRVFAEFPDDTLGVPGHGDDTTIGTERSALPEGKGPRLVS